MKRCVRTIIIALVGSLATVSSSAENLLQVYHQAIGTDPTFKAAYQTYLSTSENLPQAWSLLLPNLSFKGTYNFQSISQTAGSAFSGGTSNYTNNQRQYELALSQPLFNGVAWAGLKGAKATVKQAHATYNYACQDLMMRVANAYFNVLTANSNLIYTHAQKVAVGEQLYQTKQQYEVGVTAITNLLNAQSSYDTIVANEIVAKVQLADAMESLRQITNRTYANLAGVDDTLPLITPRPSQMESWVRIATEQNYNVLAAKFGAIVAQENISVQRAQHLPQINLTGDYADNYNNNSSGLGQFEQKIWEAGANLTIPIYQGGKILSQTRQARDQYQFSLQQLELNYRQAVANTRTSYLGVVSGISKIVADKEAIKSNKAQLDATIASYKVGTRTMVDVLNAETTLYQSLQTYSQDQYSYLINILTLKEQAGTLNPNDLAQMNSWLRKNVRIVIDAPGVQPGTYEGTPPVVSKPEKLTPEKSAAPAATENTNQLPPPAATTSKKTSTKSTKTNAIHNGRYTIELFTSRSAEHAQAFIDANGLQGKARYIVFKNKAGQLRYQVVYGNYATSADAKTALAQLSSSLKKLNPVIIHLSSSKK